MIFGWPTFKLCVTPPFSINFIYQIENQVNDYRLMGASSLNSCCSALRFLSSVLLIIACLFGLFILTVLMYVALFVNLRLLTTHLVSSNYNCITQKVRLYLEFGIPEFYKRVKYVVLQLNISQI